MKHFSIIFLLAIIGSLFGSCTEEVLNKPPLDSYTDQTVWNDLNLAKAYANGLYAVLPSAQHLWTNQTNRSWALSSACDEGYNKFDDYLAISVMNPGNLTPDNIGVFDIWSNTFSTIQNCNIFLSKIDQVPGDTAVRNQLKGEVSFLRAYAYFKLVRDYGGVPLMSKPFDLTSNFDVPRSSFDECVNFISAQCNISASMLPATYAPGDDNWGRATKTAALALKSTALLYAASPQWNTANDLEKWTKAANAAKTVIDLNLNPLFTGAYNQLFVVPNNEIILARPTNKKFMWNAFQGVETFLSPNGFHGWGSYVPSQQMVDAFNTKDGKLITDPTSGYNPQNPYANRDPRFYENVIYDGRRYGRPEFCQDRYAAGHTNEVEFYTDGLDSNTGWDNWNNSVTRYCWRKYVDSTYNFNAETQTNKFWIISRMSEMYLNYAEAEFYLGNEAVAKQYLNLIRQRPSVNLPPLPASLTGTDLLKRIQNERQVELCLEGHRYYDVRRWKIADVTENAGCYRVRITKKTDNTKTYEFFKFQDRAFKPQHYILPIPAAEIRRTKLMQNPGY